MRLFSGTMVMLIIRGGKRKMTEFNSSVSRFVELQFVIKFN